MNADPLLALSVYAFAALLTLGAVAMAFLTTYAKIETGQRPRRPPRPRRPG